ncbi:MAG: methyltransferase domain-containing protein [Nitrospirota bacterium]
MDEREIQQKYYSETAETYNLWHVNEHDEHAFALSFLASVVDFLGIKTILDVGAGTGRAVLYIKQKRPEISVIGIEPVKDLRSIGHKSGLSEHELVEGDGTKLKFCDNAFDLVSAFGILHHIKHPEVVVREMLRVGKKAIFISDSNNFGQGSFLSRSMKQFINLIGLWKMADLVKTRGKGYMLSEGDGLSYSYSVFNNYRQIRHGCKRVHILNTMDANINPYRSAAHVALLGIKGE